MDNNSSKQINIIKPQLPTVSNSSETSKCIGSLNHKIYKFGEKASGFKRANPQDFYALRKKCLAKQELFEDPDFPPNNSSLCYKTEVDKKIEWKRPHEICKNPQFFVDGCSRFDIRQGTLGDCWLLAAIANLTLHKELFYMVVPNDQGFEKNVYAGIFHFRFWQYGRWVDVVIDDRLPTKYGRLMFLKSSENGEFWSALCEKAYAKLYGCYEALNGGWPVEAMQDFTGGFIEVYKLNNAPLNLFEIVLKAFEKSSLLCAGVHVGSKDKGIVGGHAYSITKASYITTANSKEKVPLIRIRNPWGSHVEWNGPWSDTSNEWKSIPDHKKQELGLTFEHDGEFWMTFQDFKQYFYSLEICHLSLEEELNQEHKTCLAVSVFEGAWVCGATAGGCRYNLEKFCCNPQYRVTLTEADDDDNDEKCTLLVALMQKNIRSQRSMGKVNLSIGFSIYHLSNPDGKPKPLDLNFFKKNSPVAEAPLIQMREVSHRFKLYPGTYCIIPCTYKPNEEGEFLLRIFSERKSYAEENDTEISVGEVDTKVRAIQSTNRFEKEVREFFKKLADENGEVDWRGLKQVLDYAMKLESQNNELSENLCRRMFVMFDSDNSGKLGYEEIQPLLSVVDTYRISFRLYDENNSGTIDGFELRKAFASAGYNLNCLIIKLLMRRYGNQNGQLGFEDFLNCVFTFKVIYELYDRLKKNENCSVTSYIVQTLTKELYNF